MRVPKQYGRMISVGVTLAAGVLLMTTALKPQPIPAVGPVWEFSSVTYLVGGGTTICYAAASGCRLDKASGQGTEAMMNAAAKLGEKGWELAASEIADRGDRTLYFKRLKSVLNRSDSPGAR